MASLTDSFDQPDEPITDTATPDQQISSHIKRTRISDRKLLIITYAVCLYALAASIALCLSVGLNIHQWYYQPEPKVLGLHNDNTVTPLPTLDDPYLSDTDVIAWVDRALRDSYKMTFVDYKESNAQACARYFVLDGCASFRRAIQRNVDAIKNNKLISHLTIENIPILKAKGIVDGIYTWILQVKVAVLYESTNQKVKQPATIDIRVRRVSFLNDTAGLGIEQIISR